MNSESEVKSGWLAAAVKAPIGFFQQTVNYKRLFTLSNQAVDARAKLDGMQKAVTAQARQIGEAKQGIVETQEALASLESELSGLTSEFGGLKPKP